MSLPWAIVIILVETIMLAMVVIAFVFTYKGFRTVPWVRTKSDVSRAMLEFAELVPGEVVLDLGSGDGTIVLEAAGMGARAIGIEQLRVLVIASKLRARFTKKADVTDFIHGDIFSGVLPHAHLVTAYLYPEVNRALEPELIRTYPPKTRVVSRQFVFPGLKLLKETIYKGEPLYLYEIS